MLFLTEGFRPVTQYRNRQYPPLVLFRCSGDHPPEKSALLGGYRLKSRVVFRKYLDFAGTVLDEIDLRKVAQSDGSRLKSGTQFDRALYFCGKAPWQTHLESRVLFDETFDCGGTVLHEIDLRKMVLSNGNWLYSRAPLDGALDCGPTVLSWNRLDLNGSHRRTSAETREIIR